MFEKTDRYQGDNAVKECVISLLSQRRVDWAHPKIPPIAHLRRPFLRWNIRAITLVLPLFFRLDLNGAGGAQLGPTFPDVPSSGKQSFDVTL